MALMTDVSDFCHYEAVSGHMFYGQHCSEAAERYLCFGQH